MPYETHQIPYTDLHSLNLDWIIKKITSLEANTITWGNLIKAAMESGQIGALMECSNSGDYRPTIDDPGSLETFGWGNIDFTLNEAYNHGSDFMTTTTNGVIDILQDGVYSISFRTTLVPDSGETITREYIRLVRQYQDGVISPIFTFPGEDDFTVSINFIAYAGHKIKIQARASASGSNFVLRGSLARITKLL